MKRNIKKPMAVIMAAVVALGGTGIGVYAANESGRAAREASEASNVQNKVNEEKDNVNIKDETVYILSNADGSVRKIIVSDWLQNALSDTSLKDNSLLDGIVNVKGEQSFTSGENGSKQWNADGEDIYYTGEISRELPVDISVKYFLDGRELSAENMKGKSGKAVIRFEYTNNQYETVKIDGRDEKIYVPFAVLTGALLDNNIFRNVEVSGGKIINDGDRTVIVGMAFPGLQESLNIDGEKLEIPDYLEITADVKDFEMSETVSVATNEIFNNIDLEDRDSIDGINEDIKKLTNAVDRLSDGSAALYEGLDTLLAKSSELTEGIDKLVKGAEELKNGTSDLVNGSSQISQGSAQLSDGSKQLADGSGQVLNGSSELASGLEQLANNSAALNTGSRQVFDTLLAAATAQIRSAGLDVPDLTVENYRKVLEQTLASLSDEDIRDLAYKTAENEVRRAVEAKESEIRAAVAEAVRAEVLAKVTAAVRENVEAQVLASLGYTKEQYEAAVKAGLVSEEQQAGIKAAINTQMESDGVKALIAQNTDIQMQSDEVQALIAQKTEEQKELLIEQNLNSPDVRAQIEKAIADAASGRESIKALISQLDSYNEFYSGLNRYTAGVNQAADGASRLQAGAEALNKGTADLKSGAGTLNEGAEELNAGAVRLDNGAKQLYDGLLTLKDSAPALIDGIKRLRDGAEELSDGMTEFKEQGVQKLIDAAEGDIKGLVDRIRAAVNVSKGYNSFSGIDSEMVGRVKFVYRTDSIYKED